MKHSGMVLEHGTLAKGTLAHPAGAIRVAVAGATGYAGRELIAILAHHPHTCITRLMSSGRRREGVAESFPIEYSHPALRGMLGRKSTDEQVAVTCSPLNPDELTPDAVDMVFLATPHETSHDLAPLLLDRGLRVVDLSGAFRLKEASAYKRWYGFEHHAADALAAAVYGVPELNASLIARARFVSNPGCYATSIILALAPLLRAGWVDLTGSLVCDSKSGATGAGRAPTEKLHFSEVNENCRAYSLFHHRHVPEMAQTLDIDVDQLTFTPHLLPVNRGILSTIYVRLGEKSSESAWKIEEIVALFREFYDGSPLVRVYEHGLPEIQAVAHTNFADLGFALDAGTRRLIVVSAIDNLGKGAAGQAVQNMNLMYGFAPEAGLL